MTGASETEERLSLHAWLVQGKQACLWEAQWAALAMGAISLPADPYTPWAHRGLLTNGGTGRHRKCIHSHHETRDVEIEKQLNVASVRGSWRAMKSGSHHLLTSCWGPVGWGGPSTHGDCQADLSVSFPLCSLSLALTSLSMCAP